MPVGVERRDIQLVKETVGLESAGHTPSPAASRVSKVVKSAAANAENELLARTSELRIVEIYANEGPRLKRFRARARGRVGKISRRSSHITVVVDEEEAS